MNQSADTPDDEEIDFFKENAPEAVEQAAEGISNYHNCQIDEELAYRDAESAKNNDLNQAIRSTVVVATNEWKYHTDLDSTSRMNYFGSCNIGEINQ